MRILWMVFLVQLSFSAQAFENFVDNFLSPYPAGCATIPDSQIFIYGDNVETVFAEELTLTNADDLFEDIPVNVYVYRVACADPNRSVIWIEFEIPGFLDPEFTWYLTPEVHAVVDGQDIVMRLTGEPNTWGSATVPDGSDQTIGGFEQFENGVDLTWIYVLDNLSLYSTRFDPEVFMSPDQYNDSFSLELWTWNETWEIEIPSTSSVLDSNSRIPLSGRLSGNWIVKGIPDQGFVIAISELTDSLDPLMFLSWYTFDGDGNLLWLTGAEQFEIGETKITIPIELVTNGEFLGTKEADRDVVGFVTITANDCNDLSFHYELNDIGLGVGDRRLERLFSLETAGYVCRDLEARIDAE